MIPQDYEIMLTRPLFLLLDSLEDESSERFLFTRSWLQALPNADMYVPLHLVQAQSGEQADETTTGYSTF